jgi:aminobenzoyl-glutamate utilization protein B
MIKQDVYDEVQGLDPLCQEICHTLWNHPELSGNERESANFLRKILSEEGFTIENNEHLEHAFIAEYGKGKPVIAILGEYFLDYHKKQILKKKWYPKMVSDTDVGTIC